MNAKVETFTPEQARKALDTSPGNRPTKQWWVQSLANIIREGRFRLTGQPIIFDERGRLMDGHHRMLGCISADIPITVLVVRGSLRQNFPDIDYSVPRSLSDIAGLNGYTQCRQVSAVTQFLWAWLNGKMTTATEIATHCRIAGYNAQVMLDFLTANPSIVEVVAESRETGLESGLRPSTVGALMFLFRKGDAEVSNEFWSAVKTGEMLGVDDPRKRLRDMATGWRIRSMRISPWETTVSCIRAWNMYTSGESCKGIRYAAVKIMPKINLVPDEWQHGASVMLQESTR